MKAVWAGGARSFIPPRGAILLIIGFAFLLILPELVSGLSRSDSYRYNIAWTAQFRDLVRAGDLYPRWLPWSWDGLGSPTFYFYPPLYFWLVAIIDAVSLHVLHLEALISLASATVMVCSGLALFAWLRVHVAARSALLGALAYMAAPYHLFDLYIRGALAETCAYALVPLAAIAIRRLADGRAWAFFLFALTYAGLVLAHLPSALLASLFLILPYAVFCGFSYAKSHARFFAGLAASGLAAIGIAACYLLPAIGLLPFISADKLAGSYFRPAPWFFWNYDAWPAPAVMLLIVPLTLALLLMVAGAVWPRKGRVSMPEAGFWAVVVLACVVMISGAIPQLWQLVFLERVQFPGRLLLIGEFAAITCVAASMPLRRNVALTLAVGLLCYCLVFTGILVASSIDAKAGQRAKALAAVTHDYREAPEYLPRGLRVPEGLGGIPDPEQLILPADPQAAAAASEARLQAVHREKGGLDIIVESPAPTIVTVRRFYFPSWQVIDHNGNAIATAPSASHLLSWRAPAGRSVFAVRAGRAPLERLGLFISLGTLMMLVVLWGGLIWRSRKAVGHNRNSTLAVANDRHAH